MANGILKLGWSDVGDSIITAVFIAVVVGLAGVVQTPGFDVFTADWGSIVPHMLNIGFVAVVGKLAQSLVTTNDGRVLGLGTGNGNAS